MAPSEPTTPPTAPPVTPVRSADDIPAHLRGTPVETLLRAHCLGETFAPRDTAEMLIITCMDFRIDLKMPKNHAYVIRTAGANADTVRFNVDFALAVAGITTVAVIGHTDCAMTRTNDVRDQFIKGLAEQGQRSRDEACACFDDGHATFGIHNGEVRATVHQTDKLARDYPSARIVPLLYDVKTHGLNLIG